MSASLTLVTSTRNPTPAIFRRVLDGVAALRRPPGLPVDYVIIDSTSEPPVASRPEVVEFLGRNPWARVIRASAAGCAVARQTAVEHTTGDLLVWFDDDNLPRPDYLEQVVRAAEANPGVSVWGAGVIDVEFVEPVPRWAERMLRPTFQERHHGGDEFGSSSQWAPYFPFGTGLVTRRAAAERWSAAVREGRYSLAGRVGTKLGAGEDAQIIFSAVMAGEKVGVVAAQRLSHLIPARRTSMEYLKRFEFGLSGSIRVARAECFPEDPAPRSLEGLGALSVLRETLASLRRNGFRAARLEASRQLGTLSGTLQTTNRPEPFWLRAAIGLLGLR